MWDMEGEAALKEQKRPLYLAIRSEGFMCHRRMIAQALHEVAACVGLFGSRPTDELHTICCVVTLVM